MKNFINQVLNVGDRIVLAQEKERLVEGVITEINDEDNWIDLLISPMEGNKYISKIYEPQRSVIKAHYED